jgi:hypothetical protein
MSPRKQIQPFDNLQAIANKRSSNARRVYEKGMALKIVKRKYADTPEELEVWKNELKESDHPLASLDGQVGDFKLYASETVENMLKLLRTPAKTNLWKETYVEVLQDAAQVSPGSYAALVFPVILSDAVKKDLIIHNHLEFPPPIAEMRISRLGSDGLGGVIIDTFDGFLSVLGRNW